MYITRPNKMKRIASIARITIMISLVSFSVAAVIFRVQAAQNAPEAIKVGLIPDIGGINDESFNSLAAAGLLLAQTDLGVEGSIYLPVSEDEYSEKVQECVTAGNDLCIGVGFMLADAVGQAAALYPSTKFAIVDYAYESYPANLRGILFAVDEAGYLAGVLAARMTGSQVLGAIGGMQIPPVDQFIYGYRQGALCTDPAIQTLINYTGDFMDADLGAELAVDQLDQGADVIFAVAGPAGNGVMEATTQAQKWALGVDVDAYYTFFDDGAVDGAEYLLTSVVKKVDNAVYATIDDVVKGIFTPGTKTYDLELDGVGLAPFHEADDDVSQAVRDELAAVKQEIIDGSIDPLAPCAGQMQVGLLGYGGFDDQSFNWMAYQGLWRAQNELGVYIRTYTPETLEDIADGFDDCVFDGNDLCIGVGFLLEEDIRAAAAAYPDTDFAIIDYAYDTYPDNLCGTYFATDEASYLAGVLAASMPGVDQLGVIGGMEIPVVDLFIDGFVAGARCTVPGIPVMVDYAGTFDDPDLGSLMASDQIDQGADVIFPVAGSTGTGAVDAAIQEAVWAMGVDSDFYFSMFGGESSPGTEYLLTSVMKRMDTAVFEIIADTQANGFSSGTWTFNLANQGVALAPFHDAETAVPEELKDTLALLEQEIIAGNISVDDPCYFTVFAPLIMK